MEKIKIYSCLLISLVFTVFAALQYNDPDPEVWMSIYICAAAIPILYIYKVLSKTVMLTAMVFYLLGSIYMWPGKYEGIIMPMQHKIEIEQARESLGLLLCAASVGWLLLLSLKKKKLSEPLIKVIK
jgi:hypothetical protein